MLPATAHFPDKDSLMKPLLTGCITIVLCCLGSLHANAQENIEKNTETPYSVQDAIHFAQLVAEAARSGDCSVFQETIQTIEPSAVERAAYVIANIKQYTVTDGDIQKVSLYSTEAAAFARTCPAVLDIYKTLAAKVIELQSE